ncbi:cytochrome c-type biogenesis protein [Sagittula salina]|uniref:Cytochrome c-type biogenesis protein n=1 Tax=Sagittula salina TaxID=2820268 RepID=A0A940S0B7_9RHOB|nr:cytochrome c-type biogenesis protein [Sagittula salina]MBP0481862.1 cytochrome c-type biogenesis protein CcmH [Sagittula salina]
MIWGIASRRLGPALVFALVATVALAVQPDEMLDDPALEARAREISAGLRCLVCQNESIDDSDASLARDLRLLVRERLVAGDSDAQAVEYIVGRYGEFVLLKPTASGWNRLLWAAGPVMFLLALGLGLTYVRRRAAAQPAVDETLTAEEQARLDDLMKN